MSTPNTSFEIGNQSFTLESEKCRLYKIDIKDQALISLCALLQHGSLKRLEVDTCELIDPNSRWNTALAQNTTLIDLRMVYMAFPTAALQSLGSHPTLQTLDLTNVLIHDSGAMALGSVLSQNSVLQTLNLSANWISDRGINALAQGLSDNSALRTLRLDDKALTDTGAEAMATMLSRNSSLTKLRLFSDRLTEVALRSFPKALVNNACLQILSVINNTLEPNEETRNSFVAALQMNTCLQRLDLDLDDFTVSDHPLFAQKLQANRNLARSLRQRCCEVVYIRLLYSPITVTQ